MIDWGNHTANASGSAMLKEQAMALIEINNEIEALEAALKEKKAIRNHLQQKVLPDVMAEAGVSVFEVVGGPRIRLSEYVGGTIPKDPERRARAFETLDSIGGGDLIKADVHSIFARGERPMAQALYQELAAKGLPVSIEEKIHPQSLWAFIREKLRAGEPVPADDLGHHIGQVAKITKST